MNQHRQNAATWAYAAGAALAGTVILFALAAHAIAGA